MSNATHTYTEEHFGDNTQTTCNSKELGLLKSNFPQYFGKDGKFLLNKFVEEILGGGGF